VGSRSGVLWGRSAIPFRAAGRQQHCRQPRLTVAGSRKHPARLNTSLQETQTHKDRSTGPQQTPLRHRKLNLPESSTSRTMHIPERYM